MSTVSELPTTDAPLWETSDNHGPVVSVLTWFLIITAFLAILARVATRFAVVHHVKLDDVFIIIALTFGIGQSIATSVQAANGLGRHIGTVSTEQLTRFEKSTYASGMLYIATLSLIKISICLHLDHLTPIRRQKQLILVVGGFVCLWMVSSILVLAFQCQLPRPWEMLNGKCMNITGFWIYAHIINILTDLALTILPWMILSNLQIKKSHKAIIIGCFVARIFVVATTIAQIYLLQHYHPSTSTDETFTFWIPALMSSIVQAISLITACVPYLKPFMSALETGMIRADGGNPTLHSTIIPGFNYGKSNRSTKSYLKYGKGGESTSDPAQLSDVRLGSLGFSSPVGGRGRKDAATTTTDSKIERKDSDADSQGSRSKIIRKTVGWSVTEEAQGVQPAAHLGYSSRGGDFNNVV